MPLPSGFTATLIWSHPTYTVSFPTLELFASWFTPPWIMLLAIPSKPWRNPFHQEHLSFPPFVQPDCLHNLGSTSAVPLHEHPPCLWNLSGIRGCILKLSPCANTVQQFTIVSQVWVPVPPKSVVNTPDTLAHPHSSPHSGSTFLETPGTLRNLLMVFLSLNTILQGRWSWYSYSHLMNEDAEAQSICKICSSVTELGQEPWGLLRVQGSPWRALLLSDLL